MQSVQIHQFPAIPQAPADADVLAIEVNGITYKVSKAVLAAAIAANITPADIGAYSKTQTYAKTETYSKTETDNAIQQSTATGGSDYVKLPDGTMIQYGSASYAIATSIKTYSIQFSQQFIDAPVVTVSTGAGGARVPVYVEGVGKTGFELVFVAHSTTSTSWARWMAIGHWK